MFGVSFANLGKLRKKIKTDHDLALTLWDSGNLNARILAAMIADPDQCTVSVVERWLRDTEFRGLVNCVAGVAARTLFAMKLAEKWMKSKKEFVRQAGYSAIASRLKHGLDIPAVDCKWYVATIEREIHGSANWAKYSMNNTLIAIGVFKPSVTREAVAAAKRIGKVDVDHGDRSCKTPDAVPYIAKAIRRKTAT